VLPAVGGIVAVVVLAGVDWEESRWVTSVFICDAICPVAFNAVRAASAERRAECAASTARLEMVSLKAAVLDSVVGSHST
jgi:hypothetical protein